MPNEPDQTPQNEDTKAPTKTLVPTVSAVLGHRQLVEVAYRPDQDRVKLIHWDGHKAREVDTFALDQQTRLVPASNVKALVEHGVLRLPSGVVEYGETEDLVRAIQSYLHRYVDVPEAFQRLAANYVLLTWVYDRFQEMPYLRRRGDYGSGKTRFLTVVGSICYKPIFASGAATASPIFHLLNQVKGTLIIDEADYRFSDESALIAKILNAGNVQGYPLLRSESTNGKDFRPRAFNVFGPKIVGMRGRYEDPALESRFLTDTSTNPTTRKDIPISLPAEQEAEAAILHCKLLLYRFRNHANIGTPEAISGTTLEPRMQQILAPLLSVTVNETDRQAILLHAAAAQSALTEARGLTLEAEVLTVIRKLLRDNTGTGASVKDIAQLHGRAYLNGVSKPLPARSMGHVIRTRLNLPTVKSHGVFIVHKNAQPELARLYTRYGVSNDDVASLEEAIGETIEIDMGDFGGRYEPAPEG